MRFFVKSHLLIFAAILCCTGLLGSWLYVGNSSDAKELDFSSLPAQACPCDLSNLYPGKWDEVCAIAPYAREEYFISAGKSREPSFSPSDSYWVLAFYLDERVVDRYFVDRSKSDLEGGQVTCFSVGEVFYAFNNGNIVITKGK